MRIRSSTRKLEWPENADCRDWGNVKVGVGRKRLGYPAGGARRPGNIMLGEGRAENPSSSGQRVNAGLPAPPALSLGLSKRLLVTIPLGCLRVLRGPPVEVMVL